MHFETVQCKLTKMISVIIPVFNEQESLETLHHSLVEVLVNNSQRPFEIIYVDDGSTDQSPLFLKKLSSQNSHTHVLSFYKNYGQTAALDAGFKAAEGDIIIALDADLQNDPTDIPRLLAKIDDGYDVVSGWRKDRKDLLISRKIPSYIANLMIRKATKVPIHDFGCTLKAYRKLFLKDVHLFGEMHRFIPVYALWSGAKITEIVTTHHPRKHGQTHYGIGRTWRVLLDLLTVHFLGKYLTNPIYFFGKASFLCFLSSTVIFSVVLYRKLVLASEWLSPMIFIGFLFFGLAIQFLFFGILAEMLSRIYYQTKNKTSYHIKEFSRSHNS